LRAEGLRDEVSTVIGERDAAYAEASAVNNDAKLVAEVAVLEQQRNAAVEARDAAVGTVDDAVAAMEAAARQAEVVRETDPTGSSPATAAVNDRSAQEYVAAVAGNETPKAEETNTAGAGRKVSK
jgi:uncharacterized protein (UPF0335 family)